MKKIAKCLVWVVGVAVLLVVAAHFTLRWALNRESTRQAVGRWLERSTGCRVEFDHLAYGVWPPRLSVVGLRVGKGAAGQAGTWDVAVSGFEVVVDLRKGEVTAVQVERPQVTCWVGEKEEGKRDGGEAMHTGGGTGAKKAGGTGKGLTAGEVGAEVEQAFKGEWVPLKKVTVEHGGVEVLGADGGVKLKLLDVGVEAVDVAKDKPLDVKATFGLGAAENPCKAEFHAGAPEEWAGRFGEWPVQARAEVLVEDLGAAMAALGLKEAGALRRPGLWANAVGTPANGITVSGAFTDGERYKSPDITVNWKGVVKLAEAGPEGEGEIEVPVFKWGVVAVKGGKAQVSGGATAEGGWTLKTTGNVTRVEGVPGMAERVLEALRTPRVTTWLPGLAERAEGAVQGAGLDDIGFAVDWTSGSAAKVDAKLGEAPYRLWAAGTADPEGKTMDLRVELSATPEETSRLAGGRSLEGWMPSKDGCLVFPVSVSGPWELPRIVPDLDMWGVHLKEQLVQPETQERVEKEVQRGLDKLQLHSKDRQNVEAGLKLLQGFLK